MTPNPPEDNTAQIAKALWAKARLLMKRPVERTGLQHFRQMALYGGTYAGSLVPDIKNIGLFRDWFRITKNGGFIRDGKLTIYQADLERAGFDQTLRKWERDIIQSLLRGDQVDRNEIVVLP